MFKLCVIEQFLRLGKWSLDKIWEFRRQDPVWTRKKLCTLSFGMFCCTASSRHAHVIIGRAILCCPLNLQQVPLMSVSILQNGPFSTHTTILASPICQYWEEWSILHSYRLLPSVSILKNGPFSAHTGSSCQYSGWSILHPHGLLPSVSNQKNGPFSAHTDSSYLSIFCLRPHIHIGYL